MPDWRRELNERVRAVKARRSAHHSSAAAVGMAKARIETTRPESEVSAPPVTSRSSNPIVEAALVRVRSAETARVSAQPESARSPQNRTIAVDREATAKNLEVAEERRIETRPAPQRPAPPFAGKREHPKTSLPQVSDAVIDSFESDSGSLFEIEPRDYLGEEVEKIRRDSTRASLERLPSPVVCLTINAIDLAVVLLSCAPFLALVEILDGNLSSSGSLKASVLMGFVISMFYFTLTQSLCARTFGMMATGSRIVDSQTQETPPLWKLMLRGVAYFPAIAPGLAGLLWMFVSPRRRGWHDIASGTMVIRD